MEVYGIIHDHLDHDGLGRIEVRSCPWNSDRLRHPDGQLPFQIRSDLLDLQSRANEDVHYNF